MSGPRIDRHPLDGPVDPLVVAPWLEDDRRPVALSGEWAGGGLLLTSDPVRVAGPQEDPFALFDDLPELAADPSGGAVGGGWFGWLGFGLGHRIEQLPPFAPGSLHRAPFDLAYYDHVVRFDGERWAFECIWTEERDAALSMALEAWRRRLASSPPELEPARFGAFGPFGAGARAHRVAVEETVERIAAGELMQANLCMRFVGSVDGSLLDAWIRGVREVGPAYGAFVGGEHVAVASFSPELFLRRKGETVVTEPIKGTAPRDTDPALLQSSAKDRAENLMIVDLMRNDLGRVADYGSVRVDELCEVRPAAGVWHLVSRVSADLYSGLTDADLLRATFPPGSVTGAPKIQALKVISELEQSARNVYCGAIGLCSPASGLELNVAIRTLEATVGRVSLGAGGGVVAESTATGETTEAFTKVNGVLRAIGAEPAVVEDAAAVPPEIRELPRARRPDPTLGIIETILVTQGRGRDLADHLRRLAGSAERLGLDFPGDLESELAAAASKLGEGGLRIELTRDGSEITTRPLPAPGLMRLVPVVLPGGLGEVKWADRRPVDEFTESGTTPLFLDLDGTVLEAGYAAVFLAEGDRLLAPPLDGRILPSVSRERFLDQARESGLEVVIESFSLARASEGGGLVLTSSLRGSHPGLLAGAQLSRAWPASASPSAP